MASSFLLDPDLSPSPFSTFALFTQPVISCQPVHPSILAPTSSLLSRSSMNLGSGFHFNFGLLTVSASGCIRQPEWYVSVSMVTVCQYRMLMSNHVHCFDRAVAIGSEEMVSGALHFSLKNLWRMYLWPLHDKLCFWWSPVLQHPAVDLRYTSVLGSNVGYITKQ